MRVFLVFGMHPIIPAAGGVRPYVLGLAKSLNDQGHEVHVVGAGPAIRLDYCEFISVTQKYPLSEYEFIRALWAWLHRYHLDRDVIVHGQRPDELYPFALRSPGTTLVCTLHGDPARGVAQRRSFGRILYRFAERRALRAAHQVISVSAAGLQVYLERYPELGSKSTVIPVGINLSVFHPGDRSADRAELGLDPRPTLLFAGRLESEKRVEVLLESAAIMAGAVQVLVAGDGRLENKLEEQFASDHVRFLGPVSHERMRILYSAADALILPSAYEGMPTVALESLACGTPVLATPVGDVGRLIVGGKNGYLFDGTTSGLTRLLHEHLQELASMRDACVETGRRFGWLSVMDEILQVYQRALELTYGACRKSSRMSRFPLKP